MASTLTNLLYHLVFSTKNRTPLVTDEIQAPLYDYMGEIIASPAPGYTLEPLRGWDHCTEPFEITRRTPKDGVAESKDKRKSRRTKRLHGTPQAYLPSVAGVGIAASPDVNSWLKGRP